MSNCKCSCAIDRLIDWISGREYLDCSRCNANTSHVPRDYPGFFHVMECEKCGQFFDEPVVNPMNPPAGVDWQNSSN